MPTCFLSKIHTPVDVSRATWVQHLAQGYLGMQTGAANQIKPLNLPIST